MMSRQGIDVSRSKEIVFPDLVMVSIAWSKEIVFPDLVTISIA